MKIEIWKETKNDETFFWGMKEGQKINNSCVYLFNMTEEEAIEKCIERCKNKVESIKVKEIEI